MYLPNTGPKATTNNPFPTICNPNAAGSFSNDEYSDIVMVKLIRAAPRTNPHMINHISIFVHSVCSAMTVKNRNCDEYTHKRPQLTLLRNEKI